MISTILSSSVLIFMILVLRILFKGKINPMVQYGLWGLVALRLSAFSWLSLYPVESTWSVMNVAGDAMEKLRAASAAGQVLEGKAEASVIDNVVLVLDNVRTGVMTSGNGISVAASIDWQLVIMIIWGTGSIAVGLWILYLNYSFCKNIYEKRTYLMSVRTDYTGNLDMDGRSLKDGDLAGKKIKSLSVYIVEALDSPCLVGYRGEEAIYVPAEVATEMEKLRYAVAHELCHYKHGDLIWSLLRGGLLAFYWFNPLVWAAAIMSKRDCELACDYGVVKGMEKEDRLAYGKTLVDLISRREESDNVLRMATTMYGSSQGIKERIFMIVQNKKAVSQLIVDIS